MAKSELEQKVDALRQFAETPKGRGTIEKVLGMFEQGTDVSPFELKIKAEEFGGPKDVTINLTGPDLALAIRAQLGDEKAREAMEKRAQELVDNLKI